MRIRTRLRHSFQIARAERTRSQRQLNRSSTWRAAVGLLIFGTSVSVGIGAYTFGTALQRGQAPLPVDTLYVVATAAFAVLLIGFIPQTSRHMERLNIDYLLTTVSAHEVVLAVVLSISNRVALRLSLAAISVAVGFAVGTRSPASALTIVLAVAGFFALTALIGVGLSIAVDLVTTRSPRFRRYKNVFVVVAFALGLIVWTVASAGAISLNLVIGWLDIVPTAWFVDLALLGTSNAHTEVLRSMGAVGLLVGGIPLLTVVTTALAKRVWETEPVSATMIHRSRSLVGAGIAERLFADRVSRPVLTVARKRWLQERRVPRGLMMPGYLIVLLLGVFFPIFAAGEVPGISLIVLIYICGAATGLAFGMDPIGTEYSSLPMTLTTVTANQFVRGTILAGVGISGPTTAVVTILLTLGSPLGILETLIIAFGGVLLCVCAVTLATSIGLQTAYGDLFPAPLPLTSATVYAEMGRGSFIKMGEMLGILALICLPAFAGYLLAFFEPAPTTLGIPIAVIRISSLVLTIALAAGISIRSYRRAVRLYDEYTIS